MVVKGILVLLILGGIFFILALSRDLKRHKEEFQAEKGNVKQLGIIEFIIYIIAAFGISDFALNTAILRPLGIISDKKLPGTLVVSSALPSVFLAIFYVTSMEVDILTLLCFAVAHNLGVATGVRLVSRLDGTVIRILMGIAMAASTVILAIKMIVGQGDGGNLLFLRGWQLFLIVIVVYLLGVLNMIGFGMKAPSIALLLSMGLAPKCVLAILMTSCGFATCTGGISYVKSGNYQRKVVAVATVFGAIGVLVGGIFVGMVNTALLQWIMVGVMVYTTVDLLRRPQKE